MKLASYLINQGLFRVYAFFKHWYLDSFFAISRRLHLSLEALDRNIAIKVSFRHILLPMYGDRSIIGYIFGFIFRAIRICIGLILYSLFLAIAITAYLVFALIPIVIISWAIFS